MALILFLWWLTGLGKHNHFLALSHPFTAKTEFGVFCKEIVRLHGLPRSILSDRDVVFTSAFLQELFCLSRTRLCMRTSYHPQSDGQTQMWSIEALKLTCIVLLMASQNHGFISFLG